mgnify:CR=1 FL=1
MKSTPMLMSGPLVVPTLADLKTHTCRPVMLPRSYEHDEVYSAFVDGAVATLSCDPGPHRQVRCPFGTVGDRIWIRETWRLTDFASYGHDRYSAAVEMRADNARPFRKEGGPEMLNEYTGWRPSIHMPRWASRLTLEITDLSVFRVQDITEETARREGLPRNWSDDSGDGWDPEEHGYLTPAGFFGEDTGDDCPECMCMWKGKRSVGVVYSAREAFQVWWSHIYGAGSWAANPWVWGIGFKRVQE